MAQPDIELLIAAASHEGATIESLPGLLTIFGGTLSSKEEVASSIAPKSKRDACVQWLSVNRPDVFSRLLLPENYDDWSSFNTYSDLLLFEEDLGYLTAAVVIFLEAAGSIAELGAFSQIPSLRDRLVIVVTDEHHEKKSFISLGPLRQLEQRDAHSVCVIPTGEPANLVNDIGVVIDAIEKKSSQAKPKHLFDPKQKQHQFALALDVIALIESTTFTDVKRAFEYFQIDENDARIRQILFTLQKSGLVQKRRYGGIEYYGPKNRGEKFIDFRGKDAGDKFNRLRLQSKILTSRNPSDDRSKVLQQFFPKGGSQ